MHESAENNSVSRRPWRSVLAVVAGVVFVFVLSIGADILLHITGVFLPMGQRMSDSLFVLATVYRTVFTIMGGYITARLAPANGIKHAVILGVVGFVFALLGVFATWNAGPAFGPHWYPIMLVVLSVPSCWLGGVLYHPRM